MISVLKNLPQKQVSEANTAVPTGAADLTTTDTWLFEMTLCNPTGGALVITLLNREGSPKTIVKKSVAANDTAILSFPAGCKFVGGVNWVASGDGLIATTTAVIAP